MLDGIVWAAMVFLPKLARVSVPVGYTDMERMPEYKSYSLDQTPEQLNRGDLICFRLGSDSDSQTNFAYIAGLEGDQVALDAAGHLSVNGKEFEHGDKVPLPTVGTMTVPAGHLYVVSDAHQYDSVARGPLATYAVRGRLANAP